MRLSNTLVELKRIMNQSVEYRSMANVFGPALAHAMESGGGDDGTEMLDDEERTAFLARFKRGNDRLAKERFAGTPLFRSPRSGESSPWKFESDEMLRAAVLVLTDILAHQERCIAELSAHVARLEAERGEIGA